MTDKPKQVRKKCDPDCTCGRHKSKACPPDCTCARHSNVFPKQPPKTDEQKQHVREVNRQLWAEKSDEEKAAISAKKSRPCPPDCTCGRHSKETKQKISEANSGRTRTEEQRKEVAEQVSANWASFSEEKKQEIIQKRSRKCPPDCTCGRHSEELKQKISKANKGSHRSQDLTEEQRLQRSKRLKEMWARKTPEEKTAIWRKRSESSKKTWEKKDHKHPFKWGQISKQEQSLTPYLLKMGFAPNSTMTLSVGRKKPDFINLAEMKVFEFFGNAWHNESEVEPLVEYYAKLGWECIILWEKDLFEWLIEHRSLVTEEEHEFAWTAASNSSFPTRPEVV